MEWTGARYADKPNVEVQTWIDASPERVWELVSDIELMPTMSQELQSIEWLDGATEPAVGARFVGHSKHEALGEWSTTWLPRPEASRWSGIPWVHDEPLPMARRAARTLRNHHAWHQRTR
jgi:hypothetical protein